MIRTVAPIAAFVAILGSAVQPATPPAEIHCEHFCHGYPRGAPATNDLIIRDLYALSSNDQTKFADWVCYRLTPHEVMGDLPLDRDWVNDPWLDPSETLEGDPSSQDDYRGAHAAHDYDRGHFAPLASFRGSRHAGQVNHYSNIVPQTGNLNQGPWMRLESKVRDLVMRYGEVWVMTGPLYETPMPPLPNADDAHTVPSGFWKIVAVDDFGTLRVAAFIMGQDIDRGADLLDTATSVDDVEDRSGLDFFWTLDGIEEAALEGAAPGAWVGECFG